MPSPPPMQRKAVWRAIISVRSIAATLTLRPVSALAVLRGALLLGLAASDERRQPFNIAIVFRRHVLLRPRLKVLRLRLMLLGLLVVLWLVVLRLLMLRLLRFTRIKRLRLRYIGLTAHLRLLIAILVALVGGIAAHVAARLLLLVIGLALAKLFLRGGNQPEIMFGVLIIILGGNRIAGALRVAGELEIFFGNVRCRSSNFYVLPVGLVHPRQWILVVMATLSIATAHALILTVSHGLLFRQPRYARRHRCRRFCSSLPVTERQSNSIAKGQTSAAHRRIPLLYERHEPSAMLPSPANSHGAANFSSCARLFSHQNVKNRKKLGATFTIRTFAL
jgi:hypothetical protein